MSPVRPRLTRGARSPFCPHSLQRPTHTFEKKSLALRAPLNNCPVMWAGSSFPAVTEASWCKYCTKGFQGLAALRHLPEVPGQQSFTKSGCGLPDTVHRLVLTGAQSRSPGESPVTVLPSFLFINSWTKLLFPAATDRLKGTGVVQLNAKLAAGTAGGPVGWVTLRPLTHAHAQHT